jgi:hypothetical protein
MRKMIANGSIGDPIENTNIGRLGTLATVYADIDTETGEELDTGIAIVRTRLSLLDEPKSDVLPTIVVGVVPGIYGHEDIDIEVDEIISHNGKWNATTYYSVARFTYTLVEESGTS